MIAILATSDAAELPYFPMLIAACALLLLHLTEDSGGCRHGPECRPGINRNGGPAWLESAGAPSERLNNNTGECRRCLRPIDLRRPARI